MLLQIFSVFERHMWTENKFKLLFFFYQEQSVTNLTFIFLPVAELHNSFIDQSQRRI